MHVASKVLISLEENKRYKPHVDYNEHSVSRIKCCIYAVYDVLRE